MKATDADIVDQYPLSPLQHGMLFHYVQSGAHTGVDIEQLEGHLHEPIDADVWTSAWSVVADRHPILRTRFRWEEVEAPRQEVVRSVAVPIEVQDLSALSAADQMSRLGAYLGLDRRRGFDLAVAPLWRVALFRLGETEHQMVWTYSHAILDSSYAHVLQEVFSTYDALRRDESPVFTPRPAYRDHIQWLQDDRQRHAEASRAFWRQHLAGFVTPTNLDAVQLTGSAADHAVDGDVGHDTLRFSISTEASETLRALAREHDVRISTCVEAAWSLVLGAFSGEDAVVFGSTRAGRRSSVPDAEKIVGLFINTVPVRASIEPEKTLLALLGELRSQQLTFRDYEHTPLVEILAQAEVARGMPLFETIIVFNDRDNDHLLKSFGESWQARDFVLHDQTNFPMNVMAYDEPGITFKLSYARRRFERPTVERIAELLGKLLEAMAQQPLSVLGDLPGLPGADAEALRTFNATAAAIAQPECIHEAFEAQADRTPDLVSLAFRDQSLTYRELDERANRIADELVTLGVGPDCMVGLFVERSIEMVVGMLAILKAGGAYVPMDPTYPRERVAIMLEDTRAPVVLTLDRLRGLLPPTSATVLSVDAFGSERSPRRYPARARPDSLAYVIFTSGSTGRPKGVQVEHRNVANFFGGMDSALGASPGVWLALTSISFDISVLEILWTLTRGFKVVVQEEAESARRSVLNRQRAASRPIGFSLFYFAADAGESSGNKYRLLLDGARFADTHDFEAVWTPERHFHPFGGLYPNPALTSAAVAVATSRIQIRAGSVVLPLHNPIRCAEEWSVVDNLSNGRVGLSFASGWHASDFALAPGNFKDRRELMARGIETVKALWRGESVAAESGDGSSIQVRMYPPPVQREPGMWLTASSNPETFRMAGRAGASVLTNLLVMKPEELVANAAVYREAYRAAGHPGNGHITLMLHTFIGQDQDEVRAKVRGPFLDYLRTSTDLINKARWELTAFARADDRTAGPGGATMNLDDLSAEDMDALLDHAFERYFAAAGLFGTPESCLATVDRLREVGVDEIACLIDFGVDSDSVLANLTNLDELRRLSNPKDTADEAEDYAIAAQIRRHQVTHLQCTPSLLSMLVLDDDAADALSTLQLLLVGGEALPIALVDRVQPGLKQGILRNMYGPTETTIWSTTSVVESGAPITIGRPIANTSIHIVDRRLRSLPIGVPGELLIGGAGVVRGYLERPELTAQRFVEDASAARTERLYRTGDLARWLPSGDLDFLGRLDHQVKIRGYRIELGEIESVLDEHAAVRESVVVARDGGGGGDARLVAYVVPRGGGDVGAGNGDSGASPSDWQTIWEETYREGRAGEPGFNTSGWRSSFTGEDIPANEMEEWADNTAARILALASDVRPSPRVLEIGSGTGLLLLRIAPHVEHYTGVDFSAAALSSVQAQMELLHLNNVTLQQLAADELASLSDTGPFDVIVINSVIQYFPDVEYLTRVLKSASGLLAPGGVLFVGDVRSLAHLQTFHSAIELARADDSTSLVDLHARIRRRSGEEGELVVDPQYFEAFARETGDASFDRAEVKAGRAHNEMSSFRFDAVLRKHGGSIGSQTVEATIVQAPDPCSVDRLERLLADEPAALRVVGVPNARLVQDVAATSLLAADRGGETVGDLRRLIATHEPGIEPDDLRALDPRYDVTIEFAAGRPDRLDVVFLRRDPSEQRRYATRSHHALGTVDAYTNQPARRTARGPALVPALRDHARTKLPEYMVPSVFVLLEALPLTPNGKIDRAALPAPERGRSEALSHQPPSNDLEREIVAVLKELIGIDEVGVDDNFFDLGANSLLMVQASVKLRAVLGRAVPLVRMFQYPTARSLAGSLGNAEAEAGSGAVKESQDRAQVRREALQRVRDLRGSRSRS